jgi:hypothetical protein
VRGFAYEAAGSVPDADRRRGAGAVAAAGETWSIPTALIRADPGDHEAWAGGAEEAAMELVRGRAGAY